MNRFAPRAPRCAVIALLALLAPGLGACGQTGPLYQPDRASGQAAGEGESGAE